MGKTVYTFLLAALLAGLAATPSSAQEEGQEYLKIMEIEAVVGDDGLIEFVGTVHNTHTRFYTWSTSIILTIKKDGVVVHIVRDRISSVDPGETMPFSIRTKITAEDYDDFSARINRTGMGLRKPDADEDLVGELYIVEDSLNLRPDENGSVVFLGELLNGTNAVLQIGYMSIDMYDSKDYFIGEAIYDPDTLGFGSTVSTQLIWPEQTIPFVLTNKDIPYAKVESWKVFLDYEVHAYLDESIATSTTSASWGQIKQQH